MYQINEKAAHFLMANATAAEKFIWENNGMFVPEPMVIGAIPQLAPIPYPVPNQIPVLAPGLKPEMIPPHVLALQPVLVPNQMIPELLEVTTPLMAQGKVPHIIQQTPYEVPNPEPTKVKVPMLVPMHLVDMVHHWVKEDGNVPLRTVITNSEKK